MPPFFANAARQLPLTLVWAAALWPVLLWLVHARDPVAGVRLAPGAAAARAAVWPWALGSTLATAALFPPAPAFVWRALHRARQALLLDQQALLLRLDDLRQFETAARHLEVGRMLRQARKHEQAIPHLGRAVELDQTMAGGWHQLGLALFALHQWPAAARCCERAEALDPGHAFGDALLVLGRCLFMVKDGRALATLEEHARRHGGGPRSWLWLAEARARRRPVGCCRRAAAGGAEADGGPVARGRLVPRARARAPVGQRRPRVSRQPSPVDAYPATIVVAIACVTLAVVTRMFGPPEEFQELLLQHGLLSPALVADGDWWRLLAAAFLHGGAVHLVFNLMMLWSLGPALEQSLGSLRFTALYVASAVFGNVAVCLLYDPRQPVLGASGAIFGLMGAAVA
ncbi:MAG: rhomboid family intramembrane serine protease, partial [Planctomycetota bacterium]